MTPLALVPFPSPHFYHKQSHSSTVSIAHVPFNILSIIHSLVVSPQPSHLNTYCSQALLFHHPCPFITLYSPIIFLTQRSFLFQLSSTEPRLSVAIMTTSQPLYLHSQLHTLVVILQRFNSTTTVLVNPK